MNLRVARWSGVFAVGASVVLAAPALRAEDRAKASAAVDLSGRWRLDKKLSDDEGAKVRAAFAARAAQGPDDSGPSDEGEGRGPEGRRGGGTAARSGRAGPRAGVDDDDPRGVMRTVGPPDTMRVTQVESEIVIEETPGQTRDLYPDGKTYKTDEGEAQVTTSWRDGRLVVEKKNVHGWKLVETWELAPDDTRVVIHLLFEGGSRPKLVLTRVYDRDDDATPR
jgi:hypothetical protein